MPRMPARYQMQVSWLHSARGAVTVCCPSGVRGGHAQSTVAARAGDLRRVPHRPESGAELRACSHRQPHEHIVRKFFVMPAHAHAPARQFSNDRVRQAMSFYAIFALERLVNSANSANSEAVTSRLRPKLMHWMAGMKHGPSRSLAKAAYIRLLADQVGRASVSPFVLRVSAS